MIEALAHYADEILTRFTEEEQKRLRRIFVQLVRPGEGTEDIRQVATREQIGLENWSLVKELADQRLVVTGRNPQDQETVELVHEALIRHWQPLKQWIDQDRQFRIRQNRLRQAMQEWQQGNKDVGSLLRGVRLEEAESWLKTRAEDLSADEQTYIEASSIEAKQQAQAKDQQINHLIARHLAAQAALQLNKAGIGLAQAALLAIESLQHELNMLAYSILARSVSLLPRQVHF